MMWFSTRVRIACLIEGVGLTRYMDSIFVFTAEDFDSAMKRALTLGHAEEDEYKNEQDETVRWRLKEIITLDAVQSDALDGAEVYSEPVAPEPDEKLRITFDTEFAPESSAPIQTV